MRPNEKENSGVRVRVGATPEPLTLPLELKAALEWYRDEALATDAARRVLHELSIYKNNDPEKYGFAEDIELLARAALEGGVSRTEPALTEPTDEMIREGIRAFQNGSDGFSDFADWRAFYCTIRALVAAKGQS